MKHLDTFVQYKPRHTIIFMEVLEVTDTIDTKEICNVSWYMVCKDEIIIQEQMLVPKNDKTAPSEFKQAYRKARRKIIQIIKKAQ